MEVSQFMAMCKVAESRTGMLFIFRLSLPEDTQGVNSQDDNSVW